MESDSRPSPRLTVVLGFQTSRANNKKKFRTKSIMPYLLGDEVQAMLSSDHILFMSILVRGSCNSLEVLTEAPLRVRPIDGIHDERGNACAECRALILMCEQSHESNRVVIKGEQKYACSVP